MTLPWGGRASGMGARDVLASHHVLPRASFVPAWEEKKHLSVLFTVKWGPVCSTQVTIGGFLVGLGFVFFFILWFSFCEFFFFNFLYKTFLFFLLVTVMYSFHSSFCKLFWAHVLLRALIYINIYINIYEYIFLSFLHLEVAWSVRLACLYIVYRFCTPNLAALKMIMRKKKEKQTKKKRWFGVSLGWVLFCFCIGFCFVFFPLVAFAETKGWDVVVTHTHSPTQLHTKEGEWDFFFFFFFWSLTELNKKKLCFLLFKRVINKKQKGLLKHFSF